MGSMRRIPDGREVVKYSVLGHFGAVQAHDLRTSSKQFLELMKLHCSLRQRHLLPQALVIPARISTAWRSSPFARRHVEPSWNESLTPFDSIAKRLDCTGLVLQNQCNRRFSKISRPEVIRSNRSLRWSNNVTCTIGVDRGAKWVMALQNFRHIGSFCTSRGGDPNLILLLA